MVDDGRTMDDNKWWMVRRMDDKLTDDDGQRTASQCSDGRWSMLDAQMVDA
jgi:hypothetical protein